MRLNLDMVRRTIIIPTTNLDFACRNAVRRQLIVKNFHHIKTKVDNLRVIW